MINTGKKSLLEDISKSCMILFPLVRKTTNTYMTNYELKRFPYAMDKAAENNKNWEQSIIILRNGSQIVSVDL